MDGISAKPLSNSPYGERTSRRAMLFVALIPVLFSTGCHLFHPHEPAPQLPQVLPASPTREQVINVVNANSHGIQSFRADHAKISSDKLVFPLENTSIVYERQRRLRVKAGALIGGTQLDIGSNDELFWCWAGVDPSKAVYYCRHDQLATCAATQAVPFDPNWLIEALGIVEFRPDEQHDGPTLTPSGQLQIRTTRNAPKGAYTKLTTIDAKTGVVVAQALYNERGVLTAAAYAREHRRDPISGFILPKAVVVELLQPGNADPRFNVFRLEITLGNSVINSPRLGVTETFMMPNYGPAIDICGPRMQFGGGGPMPFGAAPGASPYDFQPTYTASPSVDRLLR